MSTPPNDDLDEQLYILLASMKEYREALADDKKRLEEFYKYVAHNVVNDIKKSVNIAESNAAARLYDSAEKVQRSAYRLDNKFITLYSVGFISLVCILFLAIFLFIPSLDEIQQRRADMAVLKKYPLQIKESDGKTLVRIMTKKPCYSFEPNNVKEKTYDWCQIDPKKY